jgi:hypothetical protein
VFHGAPQIRAAPLEPDERGHPPRDHPRVPAVAAAGVEHAVGGSEREQPEDDVRLERGEPGREQILDGREVELAVVAVGPVRRAQKRPSSR